MEKGREKGEGEREGERERKRYESKGNLIKVQENFHLCKAELSSAD